MNDIDIKIAITKARIEENKSMLDMAKIHMDERACMVISDRIAFLQGVISSVTYEKLLSYPGKPAAYVRQCWVNGAVNMDMLISMTCMSKTTFMFSACRKLIDDLSLPFTMSLENDPDIINKRLEELSRSYNSFDKPVRCLDCGNLPDFIGYDYVDSSELDSKVLVWTLSCGCKISPYYGGKKVTKEIWDNITFKQSPFDAYESAREKSATPVPIDVPQNLVNYKDEAEKILSDIFRDEWMDDEEWKEFKDILFKDTGYTLDGLAGDLLQGVRNGYPMERQKDLVKSVLAAYKFIAVRSSRK